ncbi:hypothetical protein BDV37DRAFT_225964 [Aspergillus pseudonomiae]|uniref:CCHC-type domain-containing protein n=1 Tax=Aspergillus pseudonomiae TaxID=1506151 RepID=A0A5N7D0L8_9EURO|nr:uncharacterized protein BDV37DRAFT_225964 [Aspergillus pseudonomiae]KAE8399759.1 hypothetical protein BDV37DRAFT_225964 [Aspergillus pseudonomiae]
MSYSPDPPACKGCGIMGAHRTLRCPQRPCSYCREYGHIIDDCPSCPVCDLCHRKGHEHSCIRRKVFHYEIPGTALRKRGSSGSSQQPCKQQTISFTSRHILPVPQSQATGANGANPESYLITPEITFPTLRQTISTIIDYLVKQADVNLRHIPYKHVIGTVGTEELVDVLLNGICPEITNLEGQIIITER